MRVHTWSLLAALGGTLGAALVAHAEPTTDDYVIQEGDTCIGIAIKALGDRKLLTDFHKLNPQLGKLPHNLVPGQVVKVPHIEPTPDAQLTGKSGPVRVRKPSGGDWDNARRGMDLFRAWRVGAEQRASAEVTFVDTQQLFLRENTVVVIYGPERRRARIDAPEAVLERGALRSRLGELSGKSVTVTTPSAEAHLGAGSAVVAVDDAGLSTVANHEGKAIDLRGKSGGKVAVKSGMGTRVAKGKKPEKPRPLPPPPAWDAAGPLGFVAIDGVAALAASWQPQAKAASYRFELLRGTAVVAAAELPGSITRFELYGAPPGDYTARLASLDKDRLEGKPGPSLAITVRVAALVAPGADAPRLATAGADDEPIAPAAPPPALVAARGARIVTDGITCAAGPAAPAAVAVLAEVGPTPITCAGAGLTFAPFTVDVTDVTVAPAAAGAATVTQGQSAAFELVLRSDAALGDTWQLEPSLGLSVAKSERTPTGLRVTLAAATTAPPTGTLRVVDPTTQRTLGEIAVAVVEEGTTPAPAPAPATPTGLRPPRFTVGGYAGATVLATGVDGNELGNAALPSDVVEGSATVGARTTWWFTPNLFVEAEAAVVPTRFVGASTSALVVSGHAHVGARMLDHRQYALHAVVGAGGYGLFSDSAYADDDVDPDVYWGLTGAAEVGESLRLRLDGRQHYMADRLGGVASAFELNLGLELVLERQ
ncbi:MAG: LysM domain-containing protein [Kofleriaceae bacterium]